MTDEEAAREHRAAQARKLFDLFREAHGRPAETIEKLQAWLGSPEGKAATAYDRTPDGTIIPDVVYAPLDEELLAVCSKAANDKDAIWTLTRVLAYKIVMSTPDAADLPEATEGAVQVLHRAIDLYVKEMIKLGRAVRRDNPSSDSEH